MIDINRICRCDNCNNTSFLKQVYIDNEQISLVKEYLCTCGFTTCRHDVLSYILDSKDLRGD